MDNKRPEVEKEVIMVIADIGGYTRFMLSEKKSLGHAQAVITALIQAVIGEVRIPFRISKLEGDAIFLYLPKNTPDAWERHKKSFEDSMGRFYKAFTKRAEQLHFSSVCACGACGNVRKLKLKLVVHAGKALFYKLGRFYELAGPDVIILHRLLKNHVEAKEYIFYTDQAWKEIEGRSSMAKHEEKYEDVGRITGRLQILGGKTPLKGDPKFAKRYSSLWAKMYFTLLKMFSMMVHARGRLFRHLSDELFENSGAPKD